MKSIDVSTCLPKQKRPQNAASFIGQVDGLAIAGATPVVPPRTDPTGA